MLMERAELYRKSDPQRLLLGNGITRQQSPTVISMGSCRSMVCYSMTTRESELTRP